MSPENAVNIPERYNFALSSYGSDDDDFEGIPPLEPTNGKSLYDSPISSYDAPIAPSRQEDAYTDIFFTKVS